MTDDKDTKKPHLTLVSNDPVAEEPEELAPAVNDEAVRLKVSQLEEEHRDLDHAITMMEERMPYDRLTLQRMKKRKLALKDRNTPTFL